MFRLLACSVVTWCWLVAPAAASAWEEGVIAYRAGQFEEAYTLWLPLAISGDPRAQNNIGVLHENGWGIDLSLEQALDWYEKAASAGHAGAQRNLSDLRSRTRATTETTRAGTESADVRQSLDRWIADQHIPLALRNKLSGVEVDIVDVIPGLTFGRELLIND